MRIIVTIAVILCTLIVSARAQGTFTANLDGLQVVTPNASPAFGIGDFALQSGTNLVVTAGSYQDLLGGSTLITINDAAVGANGPKIGLLTVDAPGSTAGTFSGTIGLTASQLADLNAGDFYVILRSTVFPAGEIRGQLFVDPVPEPASLALTGFGALGLIALRRRSK